MSSLFVLFGLAALHGVQAGTVLEDISAEPEYTNFVGWLSNATKTTLNDSSTQMTVFIPKNDAVETFLATYPAKVNETENLVKYSMVSGNFTLDELKEKNSLETGVNESKLWFNGMGDSTYINKASATSSMVASNGQVHEIDTVIFPIGRTETLKKTIDGEAYYSGLMALINITTNAADLLDNGTAMLTVFSPNSAAVTADVKELNATQLLPMIQRHVIGNQVMFSTMLIGQSLPIQTLEQDCMIDLKVLDNILFVGSGGYWSMVEKVDDSTSNGVIHGINGILGVKPGVNVYQALGLFNSSYFNTFLSKISEFAELKEDLMDATQMFTVFSPQNTAWKVANMTETEKVIKRHALKMKLTVDDLKNKTEVTTLSGEKLIVKNENGKVFLEFEKAKAELTPVANMASNGIIYAIDKVLYSANNACVTSVSMVVAVISLALNLLCK